jgi:dienelactone hydrolase
MVMLRQLAFATLVAAAPTHAAIVDTPLSFKIEGTEFAGVLIHDDVRPAGRAMLLVPNWMGINEANLSKAREIAGKGYTVYVVDMYGKDLRPASSEEAGKASGAVKGDMLAMRTRINTALETLLAQDQVPVQRDRTGAIGFCFGGTVVLELARSGAQIPAVVSFHGGLGTEGAASAETLKAKVLVLHGADDPLVPPAEVSAFESEMRAAKADWQLVSFGNAVHSFTDPGAHWKGTAEYNPVVARRAFAMMEGFFEETLDGGP